MSVPSPSDAVRASGHVELADGALLFWEETGAPECPAIVWLHGGPGSGLGGDGYRRRIDPTRWRIIGFDQRGCGRSTPLIDGPGPALDLLTTERLVADLEALREHLRIETWVVSGASWGTTYALAYAEAHPERVAALVLAAVTTTSRAEVAWITESIGRLFPREWEQFRDAADPRPGERIVDAFDRLLRDPDAAVRNDAARAWCTWEDTHVSLATGWSPDARYDDPAFRAVFATQVVRFWAHSAFSGDRGILDGLAVLDGIPTVLIHGRRDVSSPAVTAWEVHRGIPGSELVLVDGGHGGPALDAELELAYAALATSR